MEMQLSIKMMAIKNCATFFLTFKKAKVGINKTTANE